MSRIWETQFPTISARCRKFPANLRIAEAPLTGWEGLGFRTLCGAAVGSFKVSHLNTNARRAAQVARGEEREREKPFSFPTNPFLFQQTLFFSNKPFYSCWWWQNQHLQRNWQRCKAGKIWAKMIFREPSTGKTFESIVALAWKLEKQREAIQESEPPPPQPISRPYLSPSAGWSPAIFLISSWWEQHPCFHACPLARGMKRTLPQACRVAHSGTWSGQTQAHGLVAWFRGGLGSKLTRGKRTPPWYILRRIERNGVASLEFRCPLLPLLTKSGNRNSESPSSHIVPWVAFANLPSMPGGGEEAASLRCWGLLSLHLSGLFLKVYSTSAKTKPIVRCRGLVLSYQMFVPQTWMFTRMKHQLRHPQNGRASQHKRWTPQTDSSDYDHRCELQAPEQKSWHWVAWDLVQHDPFIRARQSPSKK